MEFLLSSSMVVCGETAVVSVYMAGRLIHLSASYWQKHPAVFTSAQCQRSKRRGCISLSHTHTQTQGAVDLHDDEVGCVWVLLQQLVESDLAISLRSQTNTQVWVRIRHTAGIRLPDNHLKPSLMPMLSMSTVWNHSFYVCLFSALFFLPF